LCTLNKPKTFMYTLLHAEWMKHLYIFKQQYEILFNSNTVMENVLLNFWSRVNVNVAHKLQILPVLPISWTLQNNTNSLLSDMKYLMILVYSAWKRSKITHKIFESNFVSINEIKIYIYFEDFRVFCATFPYDNYCQRKSFVVRCNTILKPILNNRL